jgi:DNA-binding CsgD family transcriptional regulator
LAGEVQACGRDGAAGDLNQGALLVDNSARVVYANAAARAILDEGGGIFLDKGRLAASGSSEVLQKAIASCTRPSSPFGSRGGEFLIEREPPNAPLHVMVAQLCSKARLAELPWAGHGAPAVIVTVSDPDVDHRRQKINLRTHFGLTEAESGVAIEILKGHGRRVAARRLGISDLTAKSHLSKIFVKTGTQWQAELVRVLLRYTEVPEMKISPSKGAALSGKRSNSIRDT